MWAIANVNAHAGLATRYGQGLKEQAEKFISNFHVCNLFQEFRK